MTRHRAVERSDDVRRCGAARARSHAVHRARGDSHARNHRRQSGARGSGRRASGRDDCARCQDSSRERAGLARSAGGGLLHGVVLDGARVRRARDRDRDSGHAGGRQSNRHGIRGVFAGVTAILRWLEWPRALPWMAAADARSRGSRSSALAIGRCSPPTVRACSRASRRRPASFGPPRMPPRATTSIRRATSTRRADIDGTWRACSRAARWSARSLAHKTLQRLSHDFGGSST